MSLAIDLANDLGRLSSPLPCSSMWWWTALTLGLGILFSAVFRRKADRDVMMNSVAPVWDANETWLVLGGGGVFAAFPLAYFRAGCPRSYAPHDSDADRARLPRRRLRIPLARAQGERNLWDLAFAGGSWLAALAQGIALGAILQGVHVEARHYGRRLGGIG